MTEHTVTITHRFDEMPPAEGTLIGVVQDYAIITGVYRQGGGEFPNEIYDEYDQKIVAYSDYVKWFDAVAFGKAALFFSELRGNNQ